MKKNSLYFIGRNPTVDLVIIRSPKNKPQQILLIRRGPSGAEPNKYALPGGFHDTLSKQNQIWVDDKESVIDAALRELNEETKLNLTKYVKSGKINLINIGTYEGNNRDPRDTNMSWTHSTAFLALIPDTLPEIKNIRGSDDAIDAKWFKLEDVPSLAFDHNKILSDAFLTFKETKKIKNNNKRI